MITAPRKNKAKKKKRKVSAKANFQLLYPSIRHEHDEKNGNFTKIARPMIPE